MAFTGDGMLNSRCQLRRIHPLVQIYYSSLYTYAHSFVTVTAAIDILSATVRAALGERAGELGGHDLSIDLLVLLCVASLCMCATYM